MFQKPAHNKISTPKEHRHAQRDPLMGVTAMVRSSAGTLVEGVVQDVSDGGVKISGDVSGLRLGDKVEIMLIIQGERVGYLGQIRHIDARSRVYGVHFESGPHRGDSPKDSTKSCRQCRKDYPNEHTYCFRCGQRLVGGSRSNPQIPAPAGFPTKA